MSKKILVVEDNPDTVAMIQLLLERAGYDVVVAYDGEKGLAQAQTQHPDLILSDIMMPHMDGVTMNRRLKENPATKDIPVVMISAHDGMNVLFDDKIAGYLVKPVNSKTLLSKLQELLP